MRIQPPMDHSEPTTTSCSYSPLPHSDHDPKKSSAKLWSLVQVLVMLVLVLVASLLFGPRPRPARSESDGRRPAPHPEQVDRISRGVNAGVSEKSTGSRIGSEGAYNWTNSMLHWQRTAFHFQPEKNWMNDPNAPLWYKGWYHLFYQWNPDSAVWGNITWGHAVSRDLVHWLLLSPAMVPDHWYDTNGVWTGSATLLPPDNRVVVLYTGSTNTSVQVQNLATPADPSDPLLVNWLKSASNPLVLPPPGVDLRDFRDPTTAWSVRNRSAWRVGIGSHDSHHAGIALVYQTQDFLTYHLLPGHLHRVPGTGMWECLDFYPVSTVADVGLDTSVESTLGVVKHVLKASLDEDMHDYYAIGSYDPEENVWVPDDPENDVGIGLRLDYGKYYASKTFFDETKRRRVLWGWSGETDREDTDLLKGWASVQTIPRTVLYDKKTGSNLLQWPIEEVESLRLSSKEFIDTDLDPGSIVPLDVGRATQLDMEAEFVIEAPAALARTVEADVGYNCSTGGGAYGRGALGPFGLLVLADQDLSEQTAVYFYVSRGTDGSLRTFVCADELRSSNANDFVKGVHGSTVPVLDGETFSLRVLVDHSIVESFAQGGRTCITSRVYPTEAIYSTSARVFLFNNATSARVTVKSTKVWHMNSAFIRPYGARGN